MSRSVKLIAYTLFALLFPFWIFLGKLSDKPSDPVAISIDSNNLKQIERIAVILNNPVYKIHNNELDAVLKTLAASEAETKNNLTAFIEQLRKQKGNTPNVGKIDVSFTPPVINVNLPNTGNGTPPTPPRKKLNTDSITRMLNEERSQFATLRLQSNNDSAIADIINLGTNEYSAIRYINLRNLCCQGKTDAINKNITVLTDIAGAVNAEINSDKANYKDDTLTSLLKQITKDSTDYLKELKNPCQRALFFGIKNTSGNNLTITDTAFSVFEFAGINRINGKSSGDKILRPMEVAYYKITNACDGNVGGIYYLPVAFRKSTGFLGHKNDRLYLNIKLIK